MQNAVGGTTLHYWAQSWRLNPWDFKVVSETKRRYGASRIPAGSTVEDWPFGLDELEPYYDKVEYEVGVSGQAGNINGKIDPRGNPFEGPRKRAYPMPPLRGNEFLEKMAAAARTLGWQPFPGPAAVNSRSYQNRSACMYHGFCNRGGCHVDAKNSTAVTTIPRAQATGHLKVVTRAHVTTIEVDGSGRMTGVNYVTDGVEYFQPAKVVLLASYTYENTRLLLLSKSKAFPNGLSNNHKQVGRHYFSHNQGGGRHGALSVQPRQLVRAAGAGRRRRQLGGRQLRPLGPRLHRRRQSVGLRGSPPDRRRRHEHLRPGAGLGIGVESVHQGERRSLEQRLPPEDDAAVRGQLPRSRSGGEGSARLPGLPRHRGVQGQRAQDRAFIQDKMEQWYREAGAIAIQRAPVGGAMGVSTHAYGGTRMGDNADTNVVNRFGLLARGAEPRHPRRVGDGHERRAESDAHRAGARVAHRGASGEELEQDSADVGGR